jgi:hypothetical protein
MRLLILFKPPTHCENADEALKSEPKNKKFRSNLGRPRIAFPLVSRLHQGDDGAADALRGLAVSIPSAE